MNEIRVKIGNIELVGEYLTNKDTIYFQGVPIKKFSTRISVICCGRQNIIDVSYIHDYCEDLRLLQNLILCANQISGKI